MAYIRDMVLLKNIINSSSSSSSSICHSVGEGGGQNCIVAPQTGPPPPISILKKTSYKEYRIRCNVSFNPKERFETD